jgi:hypothetical protein
MEVKLYADEGVATIFHCEPSQKSIVPPLPAIHPCDESRNRTEFNLTDAGTPSGTGIDAQLTIEVF